MTVLAVGEHHAGEEGAQGHGKPDPFHQRRGAQDHEQREGDENLPQLGPRDIAQHRAHQEASGEDQQRDHADRLPGIQPAELILGSGKKTQNQKERDYGKVLEQQHREGGLAAGGRQQVFLGEGGEADRGGGHGEAHAGDDPDEEGLFEKQRDPGHGGNRRRDLHAAEAENRAAQRPDPLRVELEPDQEKQQHDAELGDLQHRLRIRYQPQAPGPDRHAGDEVAEHRAQADALEDRHRDDSGGEVDERLLEKAVRFHAGNRERAGARI